MGIYVVGSVFHPSSSFYIFLQNGTNGPRAEESTQQNALFGFSSRGSWQNCKETTAISKIEMILYNFVRLRKRTQDSPSFFTKARSADRDFAVPIKDLCTNQMFISLDKLSTILMTVGRKGENPLDHPARPLRLIQAHASQKTVLKIRCRTDGRKEGVSKRAEEQLLNMHPFTRC